MKQVFILGAVMAVLLAVSIWFAVRTWFSIDTQMSGHGWIALGLGAGLSLVLGVGLMMLVFHSSRHGHDDIDYDI